MKNKGIFNFLTIEDTFDKMIEVIKTLNSKCLKREDLYERPYYDYPDFHFNEGDITKEEYDRWVDELSRNGEMSEINIENLVRKSENQYVLKITDRLLNNSDRYTWEDIIENSYSIKVCVVDQISLDSFKGYFISSYYDKTKVIKKIEGNLHIDVYPHDNFSKLMEGVVFPIHFGLMSYQEILDNVDWCDFLLNEVEPKPEGECLDKLLNEKEDRVKKLNDFKKLLSDITGVENDEKLIDTLRSMEFIK